MRYDLHLHTCLSPCADRDMTPATVAGLAKLAGAELIAVTAKYSSLTQFERAVGVGALREMLIHIAMSVTLLVSGALLFDIAERDMNK